jgi:hypothetical protein
MLEQDSSGQIAIPLSKLKVILVIIGSLAFVGGSVWIWLVPAEQDPELRLALRFVAVFGSALFGLFGVYGSVKLFDSRPGLIIDGEGMVDNSSAGSIGRIYWNDITGIRVTNIMGQRIMTVDVKDPQKYIEQGNLISRMLNAANAKTMGSPINFSANTLRIKFDDLFRLVSESFETYCQADDSAE